jgi:hypothetical protein
MLALALSDDKLSKSARRQQIIRSLLLLPSAIERTLKLEPQIIELAKELADEASLLLFGRGFQYATALEVRRGVDGGRVFGSPTPKLLLWIALRFPSDAISLH